MQSAAGTAFLPMAAPSIGTGVYRADRPAPTPGERQSSEVRPITPEFFRTMRIPLLAGRDFAASDTRGTKPVAVISETLARRLFARENPVGRQLIIRLDPPYRSWEVVGVAGDIKGTSLAVSRILETQFTAVTTHDPVALAGVTTLLGVTAVIASVVPAWRATSVDPLLALRSE